MDASGPTSQLQQIEPRISPLAMRLKRGETKYLRRCQLGACTVLRSQTADRNRPVTVTLRPQHHRSRRAGFSLHRATTPSRSRERATEPLEPHYYYLHSPLRTMGKMSTPYQALEPDGGFI